MRRIRSAALVIFIALELSSLRLYRENRVIGVVLRDLRGHATTRKKKKKGSAGSSPPVTLSTEPSGTERERDKILEEVLAVSVFRSRAKAES